MNKLNAKIASVYKRRNFAVRGSNTSTARVARISDIVKAVSSLGLGKKKQ